MHSAILKEYNSVSLEKLTTVAPLMRRYETKYILSLEDASRFLLSASSAYDALEIGGEKSSSYENHYFDTPGLGCYFQHHNGRANRIKVRTRFYKNTGIFLYELKHKRNTGQIIKFRSNENDAGWQRILNQYHIDGFASLQRSVTISYNRVTLLHRITQEKVTLDYDYRCSNGAGSVSYNNIVMAEVKMFSDKRSAFSVAIKPTRPGSLSKYCLGLISLDPGLKYNNFKKAFHQILIANNNG